MEQEIKDTLHLLVGMIDDVGKKVDRLEVRVGSLETRMDRFEERMDRLEEEVQDVKEEQRRMNEKFDSVISMWSDHEVFIRQLKKKKII
ncbi:outer membrane murein-binding lipoprotein Lpp [Anaerosolibacter carboniphilus]|uniref:Outer membrane murein-binding lipoprotein Lpp n=2 Tax=Anaerosolibacter carboniphilus TaxID=1417629 RepID=A0A841KRK8_9FIRM|nr:outer membrane murein-binding lipoprotein Lpp [Anaerosolibacter carboniphilus]